MAFSLDLTQSASHSTRERTHGRLMALPAVLWLFFFFLLPLGDRPRRQLHDARIGRHDCRCR